MCDSCSLTLPEPASMNQIQSGARLELLGARLVLFKTLTLTADEFSSDYNFFYFQLDLIMVSLIIDY